MVTTSTRSRGVKRTIIGVSVAGWLLGAGLAVSAVTGFNFTGLLGPANGPSEARAASGPKLSETQARQIADASASAYVAATIGTDHENGDGSTSPALRDGSGPLDFDGMTQVAFKFAGDSEKMVVSISSGFSWESPRNVWVASWERAGVFNVHTGKNDGTAYLDLVLDDESGRVLGAGTGVRQPDEQARSRGALPSYDDLFGALPAPKERVR